LHLGNFALPPLKKVQPPLPFFLLAPRQQAWLLSLFMAPPPPCVTSALLLPWLGYYAKQRQQFPWTTPRNSSRARPIFFPPWPKVPPAASSATMASSPRQRAPPLPCCRTPLPLPRSLVAQRAPSPTCAASCALQQHAIDARRVLAVLRSPSATPSKTVVRNPRCSRCLFSDVCDVR